MDFDYSIIDTVLKEWGYGASSIIPVLHAVQERYHYIPRAAFPYIAKQVDVGEARVYGVATFYENFSLEAKGRFIIRICDGTACHVRKSTPILEALRTELGLSVQKRTSDDLNFTVETVSCLGACGLAPVLMVNDEVHASMTEEKVHALIGELKTEVATEVVHA
ncbi:Fe-hydrogenase gamma subunit [Treponema primitia ZAS-2]|nr:NAD(P)H-dependent oxidoreductase subunit E [Treponema primitia]AEF84133.1 Fe-hydrogenase gamma subunit [Treponema primitia ZAS-2]